MESRADLPDMVKDDIDGMKKDKAHLLTNMTWVNSTKVEKIGTQLEEFEEWWTKKQESQASLPLHEAPAYTKKEVQEKVVKLQKEFDKLKKTKKPKEPKKPTAAKNA